MSISRSTFFIMFISTMIVLLILGYYILNKTYQDYYTADQLIGPTYINEQKEMLQIEVEKIVFYINNLQDKILKYGAFGDVQRIQKDVIFDISSLRFGENGCFFGNTFRGDPLFSDGKITKGSRNLWNLADKNGVMIIQKQRKAAQKPKGGFIEYYWPKMNEEKLYPKLSFTMSIPKWDWMIGAGVYTDEIDEIIKERKTTLKNELTMDLIIISSILFVLLFIILLIALSFSAKLKKSFLTFDNFFERTLTESTTIDLGSISFPEFKSMAFSANRMIELRKIAAKKCDDFEKKYNDLKNEKSK